MAWRLLQLRWAAQNSPMLEAESVLPREHVAPSMRLCEEWSDAWRAECDARITAAESGLEPSMPWTEAHLVRVRGWTSDKSNVVRASGRGSPGSPVSFCAALNRWFSRISSISDPQRRGAATCSGDVLPSSAVGPFRKDRLLCAECSGLFQRCWSEFGDGRCGEHDGWNSSQRRNRWEELGRS